MRSACSWNLLFQNQLTDLCRQRHREALNTLKPTGYLNPKPSYNYKLNAHLQELFHSESKILPKSRIHQSRAGYLMLSSECTMGYGKNFTGSYAYVFIIWMTLRRVYKGLRRVSFIYIYICIYIQALCRLQESIPYSQFSIRTAA